MWEESGHEIYEGTITTYSTVEVYQQIEAPARERLEVKYLTAFLESFMLFKILRRTNDSLHEHTIKLFVDGSIVLRKLLVEYEKKEFPPFTSILQKMRQCIGLQKQSLKFKKWVEQSLQLEQFRAEAEERNTEEDNQQWEGYGVEASDYQSEMEG